VKYIKKDEKIIVDK